MLWEFQLITYLQQHGSAFLDVLWSIASFFGEEIIMVAILGVLYWCINKDFAKYLGYSLLTSIVFNGLLKNIVVRDRPFQNEAWHVQNKRPDTAGGYSFPSGHAQSSSSLYVSMAIYTKKRWMTAIAIVVPLLVAFSRLYLGVHFPTDVLAGLAFGVAVSFICWKLHTNIKDKGLLYLITLMICSAGLFYCNTEDYFIGYGLMVGVLGAFLFESAYVNFDMNVVWWKKLLRLVGGLFVVLVLKEGLKFLFNLILPGSMYLTLIRYAVASFCGLGLYPMLFKKLHF